MSSSPPPYSNLGLLLLTVSTVYGTYNPDCSTNERPDLWCAARITHMKTLPGYDPNVPSANYDGNRCTTYAKDNGLFRWNQCCKACKDYLGSPIRAVQDHSYMNTAAPILCVDNTGASQFCVRLTPAHAYCKQGMVGAIVCKKTCGWCTQGNVPVHQSTLAPCSANGRKDPCKADTACGLPANTGLGMCTTDGNRPNATIHYHGGKCSCEDCMQFRWSDCTADSGCGGNAHNCQAMEGKCACRGCSLNAGCHDDVDCGGTTGTCAFRSTETGTKRNQIYACPADQSGRGPNNEQCKCLWCPSSTACYNHGQTCTTGTAAATCGHSQFCRTSTAGGMKCACRPSEAFGGTVSWKDAMATTALEAAICMSYSRCGSDAKWACGEGNEGACQDLVTIQTGTDPITGNPTYGSQWQACNQAFSTAECYCMCGSATNTVYPNECKGYEKDMSGVKKQCVLGSTAETTDCGIGTLPGMAKYDMCVPDYTTGKCSCGFSLYPIGAPTVGKWCTQASHCQPSGDTSAVCLQISATVPRPKCSSANQYDCTCEVATVEIVGYDTDWICANDDECGWGNCFNQKITTPCPVNDHTCKCVPAGCEPGNMCALDHSAKTCGGLADDCEGKCFCEG